MISEANAFAAPLTEASLGETFCIPHAPDDIDSWVSEGAAIAGLPDNAFWHGALKGQAWLESRFEPAPINLVGGNSAGLEQVIPMAWYSTPTGKTYPFYPCAFDPALSAAVRAELFKMGWYN